MKITAVRATPVNIPMEVPFYWSVGLYPGTSKTIIEIETDEGIIGIGEAPSWDCANVINKDMGPRLIGCDPLDITGCEMKCVPEWVVVQNTDDASVVKAFGGIELALWDIRGKAWNQPVYKLLGGAVRKEIPFTEYFGFRSKKNGIGGETSAEQVADYCIKMREEHGSTMFEGKLSLGDPHLEIATVKLLRESLGDTAMIRLDSNMSWSLPTAKHILREIEPYNIRNYEDPVSTFEQMAQLRKNCSIPFSTHVPDITRAVALGVPDNIVTNFAVLGGIRRAIRFIGACEAMGVGFWCYSGDAGVCTAAYLHVVAATEWIHEPSQSLFRWQTDDVIEQGPFRQVNNVIQVPEGPGLGVSLSIRGLKRCHQRFVDDGPINHFVNPGNPGRFTRLPRN
ncbi:MAG: mandelate racemase/muconate lactonizing enzyme family protein [Desulfobacula sp.]|jgi:glucarate dehydratase|uniref:mandelate racemase/muconate lactonizing enzyme family protein n=1 Tax=Desulfobacula sp. TaxID=2593537 RepID=UPI001DDF0E17|nr:mandelate racemase/muconate lactonizing enzyme family protein [Desulfobacula sp.]MBT3483729.1 mandelate racemase/muconate lactonizing enzyme family protein [Desulfobacula sp.]MBT3803495.1 mandelate racemase/muconate lactonizing enzyme family protein [Desulfobacula sp.]MBT4023290.1 mandelate racemase/muconate lactonizing enzyme family protein [Desulfobacula sp.]MBT4197276.1 mandelate racemase/muconate lactonizing enzyme family protein [Desulfobacula sp.]